jgi:hypothetical protein
MHGFKGSFEGDGKKVRDRSLIFASGSQQPTKKPRANKVKIMHGWFDTVSVIMY